jgi:hypothetical protein
VGHVSPEQDVDIPGVVVHIGRHHGGKPSLLPRRYWDIAVSVGFTFLTQKVKKFTVREDVRFERMNPCNIMNR